MEWTRRAAARGARVVVFPEMFLTGYPVEDLALRASFVEASIAATHEVAQRLDAEGLGGVAVVTGYLDRRPDLAPRTGLPAGAPLDAAAVLHGGRVVATSAKHHLPNYGVFDEYRYFVPGNSLPVFRVPLGDGEAVDVAIAICEDLWQDGGPVAVCLRAGAGLLVVPNASPYERGKDDVRLELVTRRAREAGAGAGVLQPRRRAGRAGLRRGLDRGDRVRRGAGSRPAVRGGAGRPRRRAARGGGRRRAGRAGRRRGRDRDHDRAADPARPAAANRDGRGGRARAVLAAAGRPGRGVRGAGRRDAGLRAEERVPLGHPRAVRRHRLGADRDDRRRRDRAGERLRGADAEPVLLRRHPSPTPRTW